MGSGQKINLAQFWVKMYFCDILGPLPLLSPGYAYAVSAQLTISHDADGSRHSSVCEPPSITGRRSVTHSTVQAAQSQANEYFNFFDLKTEAQACVRLLQLQATF